MDRNIFPILPKTACKWNSHRLSYRKNCGIALITFYNSSVVLSVRCKVSFFSMMTSGQRVMVLGTTLASDQKINVPKFKIDRWDKKEQ